MREKPAWLRPHGTPWRRGPSTVVYDNPWIRVTEYAATAPTGAPATYGLVGYKNLAIAACRCSTTGRPCWSVRTASR